MNYKIKEMPRIALGTWEITDPVAVEQTVVAALQNGYKHIDTAQMYFNEEQIGAAWPKSGVDRADFWITTKIIPVNFKYNAYESIEASIARLRTTYLDTILLHASVNDEENIIAYKEAMRARDAGLVRTIGVSNFKISNMEAIYEATGEYPKYHQIVASVIQRITKLEEYAKDKGITNMGYSSIRPYYNPNPFYENVALTDAHKKSLEEIAAKHNVSVAMVMQRFIFDKDYVILPKSQKAERVIDNYKVVDLQLDAEDTKVLEAMNQADYAYFENAMIKFETFNDSTEEFKKMGVRLFSAENDQKFIQAVAQAKMKEV